jgi:four helix bundle protein
MINSVEDLVVFQKAHKLTLELYGCTSDFPAEEKFGMISQIRRAASSICANLMEGSHRHNTTEYRQFVGIARGSAGELKYFLLLARDLGYMNTETYEEIIRQINQVSRMLSALSNSLEKKVHLHSQ